MKGSAVGLQADWQAFFFLFSAAQSQEETDENQKRFSGPQCRAGRTLSGAGFVLPMVTGHLPQVGNMLCPMHFPILLCGFVLGGPWGLAVGFAAPLLRSVLFGMPPMFPIAISIF